MAHQSRARGLDSPHEGSHIRYRTPERLAVKNARVALFTLKTRGDRRAEEMAEIFIKALPAIIRFVKRNPPPFIAKITRDGSVSMEVDLK